MGSSKPPPPPAPSTRPSGLLRKVLAHTQAAKEERARRRAAGLSEPPPPADAITPMPDPLRLAAATIVEHVRHTPDASPGELEAYVWGILRDLTIGLR